MQLRDNTQYIEKANQNNDFVNFFSIRNIYSGRIVGIKRSRILTYDYLVISYIRKYGLVYSEKLIETFGSNRFTYYWDLIYTIRDRNTRRYHFIPKEYISENVDDLKMIYLIKRIATYVIQRKHFHLLVFRPKLNVNYICE